MSRQPSQKPQMTQRAAASRLRQLLDELALLMRAFPDLRNAFDPDELPLEFILQRDARAEPVGRSMRPSPAPVNAATRRRPAHAAGHRGGQRKQISGE